MAYSFSAENENAPKITSFSARNRNETENLRSFSAENETSRPT